VVGNTVTSAGSAVQVANFFNQGPNSKISITKNYLQNSKNGVKVGSDSQTPSAVTGANTVVATGNALTGNSAFGFNNRSSFNQDGTCNWWGAAMARVPSAQERAIR